MFEFDVTKWVPKFILRDKNGYALAKAIEAGMQMMNNIIEEGVNCIADYDTMPEWRLDELAWETNCLYDYNADISVKREWIRNAIPLYRLYGTPEAIYQYIGNYFDDIDLEEKWIYDGEPYHFRLTVEGDWTPEKEAWAKKAIGTAKNVRSVLDVIRIGCKCDLAIAAEGEVLARFHYPLTGKENYAGRWPQEAYKGILDESFNTAITGEVQEQPFTYPLTGTRPEINMLGVLDQSAGAGIESNAEEYKFGYAMSGNEVTGTIPQEAYRGVLDETANSAITAEDQYQVFEYTAAGTQPGISTLGVDDKEEIINTADAEDTYTKIIYKLCGQDEI
jgi:P2-related tail formation protein